MALKTKAAISNIIAIFEVVQNDISFAGVGDHQKNKNRYSEDWVRPMCFVLYILLETRIDRVPF